LQGVSQQDKMPNCVVFYGEFSVSSVVTTILLWADILYFYLNYYFLDSILLIAFAFLFCVYSDEKSPEILLKLSGGTLITDLLWLVLC
jgi:predicted membrane protein